MDARCSVLVIDDDLNLLELLADTLRDEYNVATASDALVAADLLHTGNFDLLIVDLQMPVVGGINLIEILRSLPAYDRTPILICSAFPDLIERTAGLNVQGIVQKPFSPMQLRETVARTISASKGLPAPS